MKPFHFATLIRTLLILFGAVLLTSSLDDCVFAQKQLQHNVLWRYHAPSGACEIAAASAATQRLFVTVGGGVDVVSLRTGKREGEIAIPAGFHATSVACSEGIVAVAWAADDKQSRGIISFYDADTLKQFAKYDAGYLPDMITFTPDGNSLLVANEGEPTTDYGFDPDGSISIITTGKDWNDAEVVEATFREFNGQRSELMAAGLHICGPNKTDPSGIATVSQDVEPEYIAVSSDSTTAWVTLQENNAVAQLDISARRIVAIHPLGLKSFHSLAGIGPTRLISHVSSTGLDASDADGGPRIRHWPIWGMYQPDGIATFRQNGHDYLVTANEGDPRDYYDFLEAVPIGELATAGITVDPKNPARLLTAADQLGRLEVSRFAGDTDGDGDLDRFVCPGTRSFAIWQIEGAAPKLIFDSGSDFEHIVAQVAPTRFNADSQADSAADVRSPIRGPEPENIVLLEMNGRRIAAIGLERTGGAMLYDISRPHEPVFLDYLEPHAAGGVIDLAPEGLLAIPANKSPSGKPLLILCNEGSGTMTAWEVESSR